MKELGLNRRQPTAELEDEEAQSTRESVLLLAARIVVGLIFLIAGLTKIGSPGLFADAVRAFHIVPPELVLPFALVVPWLELLVALYLLAGFLTRLGAAVAAVLLVSFIIALGASLATGNTAHACGCFGGAAAANPLLTFLTGGETIGWWDLIRDLILLGLALLVAVRGPGEFSAEDLLARR